MNITKDFYDFVSSTRSTIPHYTFKCETYSAMHKCNRLLQQICDAERNINQISSMTKKSSAFNDHHLKFSNASTNIKRSLMDIEQEMKVFEAKELQNKSYSICEKKIISNCFDMLNSRTSDLTMKFQKFLQKQTELIKKVEERKNNLSLSAGTSKNDFNEYVNASTEEDDVLLNVQTQMNKQTKSNYYQDRLNEVQSIEKTMGEINSMMNRLGQMTYHHSLMIDNISKNTDVAYDNVEAGAREIKIMLDDVKSNRWLLIKIFLIIIVTAVIYILVFA